MDFVMSLLYWLIGIVGVLYLLFTTVVITDQEHVRIIETWGKFSSVREPGLSFKAPWPIQAASENFSIQITQIAETVDAKSDDKAFVNVPVNVQIRVDPANAQLAYYRLKNPEETIRSHIKNRVRGKASSMSFDELFSSQDTFQEDVFKNLADRMTSYGFIIENVLVDDPQPSEKLRESFDRVLASERLKEAAVNEGAAARTLSVARAEAEGKALEIKGKAWAEFRKTIAEGNAEALEAFAGKTGLSPEAGLAFFTSINEMEAVRDAAQQGGKVVFVASSAQQNSRDAAMMGMVASQEGAANDAGTAPAGAADAGKKAEASTEAA